VVQFSDDDWKTHDWSWKMKKISLPLLTLATALAVVLSISSLAHAQDAQATYKSKCAMCHGVDGKKIAAHDLSGADVQNNQMPIWQPLLRTANYPGCPSLAIS